MATNTPSAKALMVFVALAPLGMAQVTTTLNIPFMAEFEIDNDPAWTPALNGTLLGISGGATTISLNCPTIESYCQTDGGGQQTITISGSSFGLAMWGEESQTAFVEDCEAQVSTDEFGDTTTTAWCTASLGYSSSRQAVVTTWWPSAPVYPVTVSGQWPAAAVTNTIPSPTAVSTTTSFSSMSSPSSSTFSSLSSTHSPLPTTKMLLPFEAPFWSSFAFNTPFTFEASVLSVKNKITTMSIACRDVIGEPCNAAATQLMTFGSGVFDLNLNAPGKFTLSQTCQFNSAIPTPAVSSITSALCTESYSGPIIQTPTITTTTETDFSYLTVTASGAALATNALTTSATTTSAATTSHTGAALRQTPGAAALGLLFGGTAAAIAAGVAGIALL